MVRRRLSFGERHLLAFFYSLLRPCGAEVRNVVVALNAGVRMLKRVAGYAGTAIGVLGLAFVVRQLVREAETVRSVLSGVDPLVLALAFGVGLASMAMIGLAWRGCLTALDAPVPIVDGLRRYFVGQLGKYVPGGIWPVVGRAEMARRGGVSATAAYGSTVLSLGLTYLAAILVAAGALLIGAGGSGVTWQPVVALLPVGVLLLHPFVVQWGLQNLRRVSKRELAVPVPPWGTSIGLLLRHVPAWLGISAATWLVAAALDPAGVDLRNIVFATTLSWIVGFLAIGVPGGIGVREAVFVSAATSIGTSGVAATVAVVARVLFVLIDLGGAGITTLIAGPRRSPSAEVGDNK